jgi:hypothetical protein
MRSEGNRRNSWCLLHDNAPAHRLVLVKNFLAKNNVKTLEHHTFSSDLASADFYPFTRLKSALKGRRFSDATNITKTAMEELKRLSHNGFQECLPHLYSCWQNCIFAQEDCFEGNVA